jgi:prepilin-type N-terminal cleavage/methylation domain-containing protein
MRRKNQLISGRDSNGFTIIEVVLVLAIAGLIFLMVFLALPALQRSQRDTARKNDVGIVVAALQSYMSNNGGKLPITSIDKSVKRVCFNGADCTTNDTALANYFTSLSSNTLGVVVFYDQAGTWSFNNPTSTSSKYTKYGYVYVAVGSKCDDTNSQKFVAAGINSACVATGLESANWKAYSVSV